MFSNRCVGRGSVQRIAAIAALPLVFIGCQRDDAPISDTKTLRLVSFSPAVTQMLLDLGLRDAIVGVGSIDPAAPTDAPAPAVVGNQFAMDYEKLIAVRPTHVFIQPERKMGTPPRLRELAEQYGWLLAPLRIDNLQDVSRALYDQDNPSQCVGGILGMMDEAAKLAEQFKQRLDRLRELTRDVDRPRTLLLALLDPMSAAGADTFLDDVLTIAGGRNAIDSPFYPSIELEKVLAAQPDVIVLLNSGIEYQPGRIETWRQSLSALDVPAVRNGRIEVLSDPLAKLPCTGMPRVAEKLATILHPELAPRIEQASADE